MSTDSSTESGKSDEEDVIKDEEESAGAPKAPPPSMADSSQKTEEQDVTEALEVPKTPEVTKSETGTEDVTKSPSDVQAPEVQELEADQEEEQQKEETEPPEEEQEEAVEKHEESVSDKSMEQEEVLQLEEVKVSSTSELTLKSSLDRSQDQPEEEPKETKPESGQSDAEQLAKEILFDIIQKNIAKGERSASVDNEPLYIEQSENDQLTAFIQATLGALADDIEMGERQYVSHDEAYFWMTYFFLQFCGFRIFLANIDSALERGQNVKDMANLVLEIVDNVADNAEYLHSDSDVPENIAKSIIWQILNSNMLIRRYNDPRGVAYWTAADILDEILEKVFKKKEQPAKRPMFEALSKSDAETAYELPPVCREFGGIFSVAEDFVWAVLEDSADIINRINRSKFSHTSTANRITREVRRVTSAKSFTKFAPRYLPRRRVSRYPSIGDFTKKVGKDFLAAMINNWKMDFAEDWAFSVRFLMGQSDACSDFYIYEAMFGLPTPMYPVPQATCSVLFTIEVSRVKPDVCPINVTFKIEGNGLVHVLEEYFFQESWLLNVIDAKLRIFSRVRF